MANISKLCKIRMKNKNTDVISQKNIDNIDDSKEAYIKFRNQYCNNNSISIREFEKTFEVIEKSVHISFDDKPWSSEEELNDNLESIDGIKNITYISPYQGSYNPPRYYINTDLDQTELRTKVNDYYDGLSVREEDGNMYVIVSPILGMK